LASPAAVVYATSPSSACQSIAGRRGRSWLAASCRGNGTQNVGRTKLVFRPASWLLRGTIGYGYFSPRALWWLLLLVITGWFIYGRGYTAGNIVPTDKDVYNLFVPNHDLPGFYEPFHALPYSLENSFPMVKFGVQDKWTPKTDVQNISGGHIGWLAKLSSTIASSNFLRCFRWVQICIGWILTTLFVGGVTGIIRTD